MAETTDDPLDDDAAYRRWAEAVAPLMGLPLDEAYMPGIVFNLKLIARLSAPLRAFELPDEAEPAPMFEA